MAKTYLQRISIDKEKANKEELKYLAENVKLQVEKDLLDANQRVSQANRAYEEALSSKEFSTEAAINAKRDIEDAEDNVADTQAIYNELFGE